MKLVRFLSIILLVVVGSFSYGQHQITINIQGLAPGSKCKLAHYFADRNNVVDSVRSGPNGNVVFSGAHSLDHGVYFVVLPNRRYTEFIVPKQNQKFAIFTDTTLNPLLKKSSGSLDNKAYFEFDAWQVRPNNEKEEAIKAYQTCESNACREKYRNLVTEIDKKIDVKRKEIIAAYPETFTADLFLAMLEPEIPPTITDTKLRYQYFKEHYWDNVTLNDDYILQTPLLENKLSYFLEKVVPQDPDSITVAIDKLLDHMENVEALQTYRFTIWWCTNHYETAPKICMDKVFYHLAKTYYITGKCPWATQDIINKMKEYVVNNAYTQCGSVAPEMLLWDTSLVKRYSLHQIEANATVVVFWSPTCAHCMIEVPGIKAMYDSIKDWGIEVYAVCVTDEMDKWKDFVAKHELSWINVIDVNGRSDYKQLYNQVRTPEIYILDKEKRIVYKNPTPKYIGALINKMLTDQGLR